MNIDMILGVYLSKISLCGISKMPIKFWSRNINHTYPLHEVIETCKDKGMGSSYDDKIICYKPVNACFLGFTSLTCVVLKLQTCLKTFTE